MWLGKVRQLPFIMGVCGVFLVAVAGAVLASAGSELGTKQFRRESAVGARGTNRGAGTAKSPRIGWARDFALLLGVNRIRQISPRAKSGETRRVTRSASSAFTLMAGMSHSACVPGKKTSETCVWPGPSGSNLIGQLIRPVVRHIRSVAPLIRGQPARSPPPRCV